MKKLLLFTVFSLFFIPFSCFANDLDITPGAKYSILMDYDSGEVLYDKKANEKTSVASLTKMMGLIIIFEKIDNGSVKTNEILTVSKTAKEMGGSQIWLEEGEKISVDDLLKGITMASANDAMVLMAERVSGTEKAFVMEMNKKVKELGLKNTNFVNCTGFDEKGNYSTSYDMALIAKELLKHKKVLEYTSKYESYIREGSDAKTWVVNTNKLVRFYKGVDGLKTGFTDEAGSSIAVSSKKDNLRLIGISFGYSDVNTRNKETMALLDYGYNQYESKKVLSKDKIIKSISVTKANHDKINLVLEEDVNVTVKKGKRENKYNYDVELKKINFPIKKGDTLGYLSLKEGMKEIRKVNLVSDSNIDKASFGKQYFRTLGNFFVGGFN